MVNLSCSKHVVNVTWSPFEDQMPEKIQDRIQNCQASIECTNTNNEKVFKKQVSFATMLNYSLLLLLLLLLCRMDVHISLQLD